MENNLQNTALQTFDGVGKYNIPYIQPITELPNVDKWVRFNYSMSQVKSNHEKVGINFFVDDYQFERIWTNPNRYMEYLRKFGCVLSPDFSTYTSMPLAVQIFNKYRNHWLAAWWQYHEITVIPTISWSDESSFDWCFDGYPTNSIVAVSNVGTCVHNKEEFLLGYNEMLKRLKPSKVLFFAKHLEDYPGPIKFIRYERW